MLITSTNTKEISDLISQHVGHNPALIAVGEHTEIDITDLIDHLNSASTQFIGGLFPKVIHGSSILDKGIVVNTLNNNEYIG
ncbi:MAG: hypothetical protein HRU26_05235, partial [Psychroserpens sp.]|nr:hypothetical protein [Psychroserpens sp.]